MRAVRRCALSPFGVTGFEHGLFPFADAFRRLAEGIESKGHQAVPTLITFLNS